MNLVMILGMLVCMTLLPSFCIFIVSHALLMSNATLTVSADGCFWLKPVAIVFFYVIFYTVYSYVL